MKTTFAAVRVCALCSALFPSCAWADTMRGTVTDPTNAPIAGAHVAAVNRVGVFTETVTDTSGDFELAAEVDQLS